VFVMFVGPPGGWHASCNGREVSHRKREFIYTCKSV